MSKFSQWQPVFPFDHSSIHPKRWRAALQRVLGTIHAPLLCGWMVGFPASNHPRRIHDIFLGCLMHLCFMILGSWHLCSNCSFWKNMLNTPAGRFWVNRLSFGRSKATSKLYTQWGCACGTAVAHSDVSAEITVPLSFLRSLSSFPFSYIWKKIYIFVSIGEVATQPHLNMPCSRKETKFLVGAAGQTPLFALVCPSREWCHGTGGAQLGRRLSLRRAVEQRWWDSPPWEDGAWHRAATAKRYLAQEAKAGTWKLHNSHKRCSACNAWWNMDQCNCFLRCWSISKSSTETPSIVLPLHTSVAAANSLSLFPCWQRQASWFIFCAVLNIWKDMRILESEAWIQQIS